MLESLVWNFRVTYDKVEDPIVGGLPRSMVLVFLLEYSQPLETRLPHSIR